MEPIGSLPCSDESATCLYSGPNTYPKMAEFAIYVYFRFFSRGKGNIFPAILQLSIIPWKHTAEYT